MLFDNQTRFAINYEQRRNKMKKSNKNQFFNIIEQWEIWWILALFLSFQPFSAQGACSSDDHKMIILSQADGISFHSAYYKVSRESIWTVWNVVDDGTSNKGEELITNKVDFIQWSWANCYDYDWKLTVMYNNHSLMEEFKNLEGDHKYAAAVLAGQGGNTQQRSGLMIFLAHFQKVFQKL